MSHGMTPCMMEGIPSNWGPGHRWSADWEDVTCQECLLGREVIDTFTISTDGKSITCKRCNKTSYNTNDVEQHYCGFCHVFHDDIWPPARRWWITNPGPDLVIVVCDCGYRLAIKRSDLDEIQGGVWGTIPCPACRSRLNDKIKELK